MTVAAFAFTFLASALSSTPSRFAGVLGLCSLSIGAVGFVFCVRTRSNSFGKVPAFFLYLTLFFARLSNRVNDTSMALAFGATDRVNAELFSLRPDFVRRYTPFL